MRDFEDDVHMVADALPPRRETPGQGGPKKVRPAGGFVEWPVKSHVVTFISESLVR